MRTWSPFVGLAKESAEFLAFSWPVTALLLLFNTGAALWSRRELGTLLRTRTLWQLLPLAVVLATLALGALFECQNCSVSNITLGHRHPWAVRASDILFLAQLLAYPILVKSASPLRVVAASFQLFLLWCSFWAVFVAQLRMWPMDF